ncbi:MAG: preprotein translocase subunit SecE [Alphaproteobacteria bacterium]|nr:preprotein translocase subunit SecE [Alphaproteobacteria bacterium]
MNKFKSYIKESYIELLEKVSWPKWNQLQQSTIITILSTIFITLIIWAMDFISSKTLEFIYSIFK